MSGRPPFLVLLMNEELALSFSHILQQKVHQLDIIGARGNV